MADDWIKMRSDLYRDPKVIVMADDLMRHDGDLAAFVSQNTQRDMTVTRNVTRNAAIGGLLSVWGVIRKQGQRENDDLILKGCQISVLDDISEMPGFGNAMELVGWVQKNKTGLLFPRFFEENNSDKVVTLKAQAAERQRKFRERNKPNESNAESNVTVTLCNDTEESREEKSIREREREEEASPPALAHVVPTGRRFPDHAATMARINALRPEWGRPSQWTGAELHALHDALGQLEEFTDEDWNGLKRYFAARLEQGAGYFQPKSRGQFVANIADVFSAYTRWISKGRGRGPATIAPNTPNPPPPIQTEEDKAALAEFLKFSKPSKK